MTKKEAMEKGAKYYCMSCNTAYVHLPKIYDDQLSCEGAYRTQCRHCDCDLICYLADDSLAMP